MKLSVVDQSPVSSGMTPGEALRNTIDLARHCDRLGYERYWIAEHHGMEVIATSAPEIMIGLVARPRATSASARARCCCRTIRR
ncbi:MAG: LLM class flavin-dependent oxidoreductase [Caulobacteraceae bacterium]